MAAIGGGQIIQKALERTALNDMGTGLAYGNGTTPFELGLGPEGPKGTMVGAVSFSVLSHLNGGTITAGTLTIDVSLDGINWTDSGVTGVPVPTTDSGYAIITLSKYSAAQKMPARFVRGKIASAASTGAPTVDIAAAA